MISNETFMKIAYLIASESKAVKRKVGAVIVKDNNIIALGYNGTPRGFDNTCEDIEKDFYNLEDKGLKTRPEVLHAESNAIMKCSKSTYSSEGAEIYTTTQPCIECSKLIIQSGIKKVFFTEQYKNQDGTDLLKKANIEVFQMSI